MDLAVVVGVRMEDRVETKGIVFLEIRKADVVQITHKIKITKDQFEAKTTPMN